MNSPSDNLARLLRSAAQASDEVSPEPPFGFAARVVALARAEDKPNGIGQLLRRVALISAAVLVLSTIAAVREARQNRDIRDSLTSEYAIADNAIQTEFSQ